MTYSVTITENYILLTSDEKIKEGDYTYHHIKGIYAAVVDGRYTNQKKIIAHLPLNNSPILEGVPLLPPLPNEDDVEKLAEEWMIKNKDADDARYTGFIDGYNKAKEKYKYTEEDVRRAIKMARDISSFDQGMCPWYKHKMDEIIQSLSQPKHPTHFEVEEKPLSMLPNNIEMDVDEINKPLIINGVMQGEWIF